MKNEIIQKKTDPVQVEKIQTYLETMNLTANLSKSEVKQFIEISQAFGLNPFKREIYASKFGDRFSIIVGFETYLKRAERSGLLSGWSVTTDGSVNFQNVGNSNITATITIYRKDWKQPFIHTVHFSEYCQRTAKGEVNKFWREKPLTMIKKVAMAQGFRLCFSDENGGLPYTSEEMGTEIQTDSIVVDSNIIEQVKPTDVKRGRPKKVSQDQPEISMEEIIDRINTTDSVDELLNIYNNCPDCAGNPQIMEALSNRKKYLVTIQKINDCKMEDEIWAITENITDPNILSFANQKIESLTSNNNIQINDNELF